MCAQELNIRSRKVIKDVITWLIRACFDYFLFCFFLAEESHTKIEEETTGEIDPPSHMLLHGDHEPPWLELPSTESMRRSQKAIQKGRLLLSKSHLSLKKPHSPIKGGDKSSFACRITVTLALKQHFMPWVLQLSSCFRSCSKNIFCLFSRKTHQLSLFDVECLWKMILYICYGDRGQIKTSSMCEHWPQMKSKTAT